MGAEIKSNTENRNISIFRNLIFLLSSECSYESAHGHILAICVDPDPFELYSYIGER